MHRSLLILLIIVGACNPASKKSVSKTIDNPQVFRAGGVTLRLPGTFIQSSFLDVAELWGKSGKPEELIFRKINEIQSLQAFDGPSFIFRDTTDVRNTFFFTEASYLDVEEGNEEKMFSDFQSVMIENCKKAGATCHLLENDFFSLSNGDEVFKMSYEVAYPSDKEYSTTYFIATETRIVMVVVHNTSDDGEASVRSMNVDRYFYVDPLPAD
jgi:hypothetical protein